MRVGFTIASIFSILAIAAGCSNSSNTPRGLAGADAAKLNDAHASDFDKKPDPPMNADTHFAAGQLAEGERMPQAAIKQYKECLKLNPKHLGAWYRLGVVYAQVKQFPDAVDAWNQYITFTNFAATGYSNLGYCLELANRNPEAEAAYKKGIARDPKNEPCRVNYGLMLARHGRSTEAVIQLQSVLTPAQVHYNLASVYESQNQTLQAKMEYRKALELDPKLVDAQTRLSKLD